jgi:hypothetical protein
LKNQQDESSTPASEDEQVYETNGVVVVRNGWEVAGNCGPDRDLNLSTLGDEQCGNTRGKIMEEEQEQTQNPNCYVWMKREGEEGIPDLIAPTSWSSIRAQEQAEAQYLQALEERFSWMNEADREMLRLGLEPYPWDQFAEEIAKTGETEFQAIEQRGNAGEVFRGHCPQGAETIVGATLVIRFRTIVTSLNMVSDLQNAPQATARMLFKMADALPVGAQLDLIVSSDAVLIALGACADILTKGLDIDFYCQDPEWNNMMKTWK